MSSQITIDTNSQTPVYKQLINNIQALVNSDILQKGDVLPSLNELSHHLGISKETVKKSYVHLRNKGIIESAHGKGFYIVDKIKEKISILLIFDKISSHKQVLLNSFTTNLNDNTEITIRLHNQDISLFEKFVEENIDRFDFFVITPHFPLDDISQKRVIKILKKIPNRKLILLDRKIEALRGNYGVIYQDFEIDVYKGLSLGIDTMKKFDKLKVFSMPGSLYARLIEKGISRFCSENKLPYEILHDIDINTIQKNEVYLVINSQLDSELIELIRTAKTKDLKIGSDIGIISYNESPINEIILDGLTVISTDFTEMGRLAAKMITTKSFEKVRCNFLMIRRSSF
ncbi:GntR family transcriptional regulator [Membranihabitans marinus]